MGTFFMFGRYSHDSIKSISARRTEKTKALIEKYGGRLVSAYALLGDIDLVLILELPGKEEAMKTSVALSKMLGIGFTTAPAVTVITPSRASSTGCKMRSPVLRAFCSQRSHPVQSTLFMKNSGCKITAYSCGGEIYATIRTHGPPR
jgi:uncharacterized protein with GYD domain